MPAVMTISMIQYHLRITTDWPEFFKSTETLWGKAANEALTAPSTPLHELLDRLPDNQGGNSTVPVFPSELKEVTEGLNPVVYSTLKEPTNENRFRERDKPFR